MTAEQVAALAAAAFLCAVIVGAMCGVLLWAVWGCDDDC